MVVGMGLEAAKGPEGRQLILVGMEPQADKGPEGGHLTGVGMGPQAAKGPEGRHLTGAGMGPQAAKGPGDDVRAVGSDIAAGEVVLQAGDYIAPAEVGILATVGATRVRVYPRAHVGVLSTGDEVVEPSVAKLGPGQIRDANRAMLIAAARTAGNRVTDLGIARDTAGAVEACFQRAIQDGVDVLITSGACSAGSVVCWGNGARKLVAFKLFGAQTSRSIVRGGKEKKNRRRGRRGRRMSRTGTAVQDG
jgi:Probable molybdopterin binding domain/MoeA N-terminal region (domain I and II)